MEKQSVIQEPVGKQLVNNIPIKGKKSVFFVHQKGPMLLSQNFTLPDQIFSLQVGWGN